MGRICLLHIMFCIEIYLIDTNMNIIFTGSKTTNSDRFMSLMDGEHIKFDRNKFVVF